MTTHSRHLALFDLDHTLLPIDSDYTWADFLARTGRAGDPDEAIAENERLMTRYNAGELTPGESATFMLGLLARSSAQEVAQWHEEYMQRHVRPAIKPEAIQLVQSHLEAGHLCAIVTATNTFVTAPIARAFGITTLIGTVPEYKRGRYTGNMIGIPCFQKGKIEHVEQWLSTLDLSLKDFERSYFYSDSINDVPLMEEVTDPVATNPSPSLREYALGKNWKIIDLFA